MFARINSLLPQAYAIANEEQTKALLYIDTDCNYYFCEAYNLLAEYLRYITSLLAGDDVSAETQRYASR